MNQGQLMERLTQFNPWWAGAGWERTDPDLESLVGAPFRYEPAPLHDISPDGLYLLRGPRRVGKSVEVKRAISRLIATGVNPRSIIHFACNGLSMAEIQNLVRAAERLLRQLDSPRYWFFDEITAAKPEWTDAVAALRDTNSSFKRDCVVLTGSSTRNLDVAVKALADRRGQRILGDDRVLLPMGFRSFCRLVEPERDFPGFEPLPPREFAKTSWRTLAYELVPFLDDLVGLWELYLTVGGFPRAVWDYLVDGRVNPNFVQGLWQVVYGEALRVKSYPALQIQRMLSELAARLTAPTNFTQLAEDCGFADHSVATDRCDDLVAAYMLWPCYKIGPANLPRLNAQRKFYFYDPLLARLANLLDERNRAPGFDALSEQQLGLLLLKASESEPVAPFVDYSKLMFMTTPSRSEIDFVGPAIEPAVFESKYIDSKKTAATATITAQKLPGIMASRAYFDPEASVPWLPTALLAWMIERS